MLDLLTPLQGKVEAIHTEDEGIDPVLCSVFVCFLFFIELGVSETQAKPLPNETGKPGAQGFQGKGWEKSGGVGTD